MTLLIALIVTVQVLAVPEQPPVPDQPANEKPEAVARVSVTEVS